MGITAISPHCARVLPRSSSRVHPPKQLPSCSWTSSSSNTPPGTSRVASRLPSRRCTRSCPDTSYHPAASRREMAYHVLYVALRQRPHVRHAEVADRVWQHHIRMCAIRWLKENLDSRVNRKT